MAYDYLIIGAGLFGSVLAERISNDLSMKVLVIDKRDHIGGNCYSEIDQDTDIEIHKYGTHIFHTSSKNVWDYICRFTEFNGYHHQVLTSYKNKIYQMPINLETINSFYNLNLRPNEARDLLKREIAREGIGKPQNLEEKAVSLVGRPLYEALIKGYTIKQWGKDPKELPADIITRLPVRFNYREDYFVDSRWQGIPLSGYTKMIERMLKSPKIHIELNCDYFKHKEEFKPRRKMIYTGPIDQYFDYIYGNLEWRSISLKRQVLEVEDYQGNSVMNFADIDISYTRIHENKHLHPERKYSKQKTVIFYEESINNAQEPYYPINNEKNNSTYQRYRNLARKYDALIIGGRQGNYKYYDMDKAILAAFDCYENDIVKS